MNPTVKGLLAFCDECFLCLGGISHGVVLGPVCYHCVVWRKICCMHCHSRSHAIVWSFNEQPYWCHLFISLQLFRRTCTLCLQVSPDGQFVAFTQDTCGDETFTLVIMHIARQAVLLSPGQVTGIKPSLEWSEDSTRVVLIQVGIPLVGADSAISCSETKD